ncbi:free fatty acid receptor 4 [Heliangelus exortis]|uniref:free fatty acid receptor 4 n=1 Tax=Heliangelus exortis TaxID=472823 RepID=UPI003A8F1B1A
MLGSRGAPGRNKTFFPFFSDFRGHNVTALRIGESSALVSIFLLALAGNIWGICLLMRQRHRLCAANCLVLNLFCADLLFVTAIPFITVVRWTESWVLGNVVCHMLFYVVSLSGTVVILSLSAVSLERVVSIARLRHTALRRRKALAAALLLIWGFAALATLPLCCFFTVVRLPAAGGEVRARAAWEGRQGAGRREPARDGVPGAERAPAAPGVRWGRRARGRAATGTRLPLSPTEGTLPVGGRQCAALREGAQAVPGGAAGALSPRQGSS